MKTGDIVELIEDMTFYKKGRKATFIKEEVHNLSNAEIVWYGEESAYKEYGDCEIVPKKLLRVIKSN